MITLKEIKADNSDFYLSLSKLMGGKKVKDIQGYLSQEFGDPVFKLCKVVFEDGTQMGCEGEHDLPYLTDYDGQPNMDEKTLTALCEERDED